MSYQAIFKRYEIKYILTKKQKEQLLRIIEPYMALDEYGLTSIRNLYLDTGDYRIVRRSIERPVYKEKLRIRSYGAAQADKPVFVELKKKYQSVVYKRRLAIPENQAISWLCGKGGMPVHSQIADEIEYFRSFYYPLHPAAFLSYEREAFYSKKGDDFRVTFDDNILSRNQELSLEAAPWGTSLLADDKVLMELKTAGGIPLWMTRFLTQQRLFKASFSKYGTAYQNMLNYHLDGGRLYA